MTTSRQKDDLENVAEGDFLISPDDLVEIMEDLRGEELSLEEIAQVLLDGGIELEYLATKYKTNKGDQNLLVVIACQDNLEVDWDDLARRCEEVVIMVVGDYYHNSRQSTFDMYIGEDSMTDLIRDASYVNPGDPRIDQMRYVDFHGHISWLKRVIAESPRARLRRGGVAPVWCEPDRGPIHNRTGDIVPGPDLGSRPMSGNLGPVGTFTSAHGIAESRIFPGYSVTPKGVAMSAYAKMVKEDFEKTNSILSTWSKDNLIRVLEGENQNPLGPLVTRDRPAG